MLTILFLCGCLEPGKDGVGDYTRKIAGQLCRVGHKVQVAALNDPFIKDKQEQSQPDGDTAIQTLRLPATLTIRERVRHTWQYVKAFNPHWISLQYVPYAFHHKGLPIAWIQAFKKCAPEAKWHVMMHELWIGSKKTDSLKDKLVGYLQKLTIQYTLNSIRPVSTTSSLPYYQDLLKGIGYTASILPVFNNIGIGNITNTVLYQQLIAAIPDLSNYYIGVLFGGLHADEEVYDNIALLMQLVKSENKQMLLVHIGRSGAVYHFFDTIKQRYGCACISLAEQEPIDIASFFCRANFGVSTYSAAFLNKSGSVAAMLNNKLPVILLKSMEIQTNTKYEYARHITEISAIKTFMDQNKDWSSLYGLENAFRFYNELFLRPFTQQ